MVDVSEKRVQLLCESALRPDEINEEAERRQAKEAWLEIAGKAGTSRLCAFPIDLCQGGKSSAGETTQYLIYVEALACCNGHAGVSFFLENGML